MKRNIKGQFSKGFIPHNKGKRINLDLKEINKRHWNNGESILDISKDLKVSDALIRLRLKENGFKIRKNTEHSNKIKEKISNTLKKRGIKPKEPYKGKVWNKGKTLEEQYGKEESKKVHKRLIKNRANQVFPLKDSSIEIKAREFLDQLKINYIQHKNMNEIRHAYQCDFFIPIQKGINKITIIEVDGCYWHGCQKCMKELNNKQNKQRHKDNKRTYELRGQGYRVIRLWEHEINKMTLEEFKGQIYK
jgi:very-short-patch-repair endonuclease